MILGSSNLGSNYLEVHFVQQAFLYDRKGAGDPEPILFGIANPKFIYEEQI